MTSSLDLIKERWAFFNEFLYYLKSNSAVTGTFYKEWITTQFSNTNSSLSSSYKVIYHVLQEDKYLHNFKFKNQIERQFVDLVYKIKLLIQDPKTDFKSIQLHQYLIKEIEIQYSNLVSIPSALLTFFHQNQNDTFTIHLKAWNDPTDLPSLTIDSIWMYKNEIKSCYEYLTLTKVHQHLLTKQLYLIKNIRLLQESAFPGSSYTVSKLYKTKYLEELYEILVELLPYLESYVFQGIYPDLFIQTQEECPITGVSAPYPSLRLQCKHLISVMAYKGLIQKHLQQDLKCPYCRAPALIQMIDKSTDSLDIVIPSSITKSKLNRKVHLFSPEVNDLL
jgi:hypothetical protein